MSHLIDSRYPCSEPGGLSLIQSHPLRAFSSFPSSGPLTVLYSMLDFRLFKPPYPCSSSLWVKDGKVRRLVSRGYTYLLASLSSISLPRPVYAPRKDTDRLVRSTLCSLILSQKGQNVAMLSTVSWRSLPLVTRGLFRDGTIQQLLRAMNGTVSALLKGKSRR